MAATVVAASAAVTMGVAAWPAEGQPHQGAATEPVVTRVGDLPAAASVTRAGTPAGHALARLQERQRRGAARDARHLRQAQRASRSASRTVHYGGDPRRIASAMMAERYGWGSGQFGCLSSLWQHESGWRVHASNSSGAYGIPQALPGGKMGAYGPDWQNNPVTQIEWGLAYIRASYGTPCGAWSTFQSRGWY